MSQIFHPSANPFSKASIFGAVFLLAGIIWILAIVVRSPYFTNVGVAREQPVPFSHEHHVNGLGLDCRYCHTSVEESPFAGIPPTKTCMTCHSQVWTNAQMLEPIRQSWQTGTPVEWTRVHDLPDFVYFNHSIHVQKGIGCETCHGEVDQMPLMWRTETLLMEWCLDCHRQPAQSIRPREEVFNTDWHPPVNQTEAGQELVQEYHVQVEQLDDCTVCHR